MAYRVLFSTAAEEDGGAIASYLADTLGTPHAALRFLDELDEQVGVLEAIPESFPSVLDARLAARGYRKAPVKGYVVLLRVVDDIVQVARIFHQRQDYARLL